MRSLVVVLLLLTSGMLATCAKAGEPTNEQLLKAVNDMQHEIDELKHDKQASQSKLITTDCDKVLDTKYGPNAPVTTKVGKLRIGALTQIWYYGFTQKDNKGLFQDNAINGIQDTNEPTNNSSFRIRRTELHFQMDMTPNVTSYVILDPAREATSYPNLPNPQGFFKRANQVAPEYAATKPAGLNSTGTVAGVQSGTGTTNRALQDAWIDFHDCVPHHDFGVGQLHPWFGEEGIRTSRELDFCERSQIGFIGDSRDLGAYVHGAWWGEKEAGNIFSPSGPGRFQYWLAVWDGAGTYHSAGAFQNRPDDNDQKDFNYRVLVRPLWKSCVAGSLELGMSSQFGEHGQAGGSDPINSPVNGLNRERTWAIRHDAWMYYAPGGPVKGLWLRGEYAYYKDRNAPGSVIDLTGDGGVSGGYGQANGHPFVTQGYYAAIGYKLSDSIWAGDSDCGCGSKLPNCLKQMEFAARYDSFQNVQIANPANASDTQVYKTDIYTAGVNYYIKGNNAKIQFNYNVVVQPTAGNGAFEFHQTKSNNFIMNFQVGF